MSVQKYTEVSLGSGVDEASPHRLIQMLFEGALERVCQAKGAVERKDFEVKSKKINALIDILASLESYLDREQGSDVADNLAGLYGYMQRQLIAANVDNDLDKFDEVTKILLELKGAWDQIPPELHHNNG